MKSEQYSLCADADDLPDALEMAAEWLKTMRNTFGDLQAESFKVFYDVEWWIVEITLSHEPMTSDKPKPVYAEPLLEQN